MKKISILVYALLIIFTNFIIAQTNAVTSGVYPTLESFVNNKLLEEADCKNDKEKFEKHDFLSQSFFTVINKGKKTVYQKKDIYAYRDCDNNVWRFYNNKEYQIVEKKAIYIYKLRKVVLNGITVEKEPVYFFSKEPSGDIKELTINNLKAAYPANKTFHNMLDSEFDSEREEKTIHSYDKEHKMFKVNYLFIMSNK